MTDTLSRQQRRQMLREELKKSFKNPELPKQEDKSIEEKYKLLVSDVTKLYDYIKALENQIKIVVDTLDRKGTMLWSDVNETERLYVQKEANKRERIKELLGKSYTTEEYLTELETIKDLNINPIYDLNLNPYEITYYLTKKHPNLKEEQYLAMGRVWGLNSEHFGFKKV